MLVTTWNAFLLAFEKSRREIVNLKTYALTVRLLN